MTDQPVQVSDQLHVVATSIGVGDSAGQFEVELTRGRRTTLAYGATPSAALAAAYAASTKEPGPRPSYFGSSVTRRRGHVWNLGDAVTYPDADVMDVSSYHIGQAFQLRIARTDPETGTDLDLDGDRALERISMYGAGLSYFEGGLVVFRGFVRDEQTDPEKDADDVETYHPEEWRLRPDRPAHAEETT